MNSITHIDELGLRRRAESKLAQADLPSKLMLRDPVRMLHELQVHQIELEMQNEELLAANHRAEDAATKYRMLHSLAPVAFLTVTDAGTILEANRRAEALLRVGSDQANIVGGSLLSFFESRGLDGLATLLSAGLELGGWATEELELRPRGHHLPLVVHAQVQAVEQEGRIILLIAMTDVTRATHIRHDMAAMLIREQARP